MRKSTAALLVAVVAVGVVAALLGTCGGQPVPTAPTTKAPEAHAAESRAPAPTTPRVRRGPAVPSATEPEPRFVGARAVVAVEVVDAATGRPVARAALTFEPNGENTKREECVADDAGRAEVALPPGAPFTVKTKARGHFQSLDFVRTAALDAPPTPLRVTLAPSVAVRGVVRDPDGGPADGVFVCIERADGDDAGDEFDCVSSDAAGAYEIDGLEVGASYTVWAPASGDWSQSARTTVSAGRDGAVADLRLRKPRSLELSFVDDDGAPVERVEMRLDGEGWTFPRSGVNGSVVVTPGPGRYALKAWKQDRVPVSDAIDVEEGAAMKRRIVLASGASIEGVVVDDAGAPVADARVRQAAAPIHDEAPTRSDQTDDDGAFRLVHLAPGTHDLVVEPPPAFEPLVVRGTTAPSARMQFVVARRGALALRVAFEDDARPAPKARIAFHGERDGRPWDIDRPLPEDGRFATPWPADVRGELGIAVDGFLPVTRAVNVPPGAAVDLGEIRVRRGASLVGVVRAEGPGANFPYTVVVRGAWHGGRCKTDDQGRFAFDGLAPGFARIAIEKTACSFRVAVPSREPVVLVVQSSSWLNATLSDAAGAPVAGRRVVVRDSDGEEVSDNTTDARGVSYHSLPPGKYAVEADGGAHATVEVRPGEVAVVKLR